MLMGNALIAGSFDPVTIGHKGFIETVAKIFNKVYVAVGNNPEKINSYMFPMDARQKMVEAAVKHIPNVEVGNLGSYYIYDYATSKNVGTIILGLRHESEFESVHKMAREIYQNGNGIVPFVLVPTDELINVSSSYVKALIGPRGWEEKVKHYLTEPVYVEFLKAYFDKNLGKRWAQIWQNINATGNPDAVFEDLSKRYSEKHRAYHTLEHIRQCLLEFDQVRSEATYPEAIELAIWYHDIIWSQNGKDNEERSAAFFNEMAKLHTFPEELISSVIKLILATKHHEAPTNLEEQILADIDLSILGQPQNVYDNFVMQIHKEYSDIPIDLFNAARIKVLNKFYARPCIYSTPYFRNQYETSARINIQNELDKLV